MVNSPQLRRSFFLSLHGRTLVRWKIKPNQMLGEGTEDAENVTPSNLYPSVSCQSTLNLCKGVAIAI
jgi:hypothetical protein